MISYCDMKSDQQKNDFLKIKMCLGTNLFKYKTIRQLSNRFFGYFGYAHSTVKCQRRLTCAIHTLLIYNPAFPSRP